METKKEFQVCPILDVLERRFEIILKDLSILLELRSDRKNVCVDKIKF